MLEHLVIKNYVLISSLEIDFSANFAVLTGETGSGKSIILGALALLLGEKAKGDVARLGEKEATITALFSFEEGSEVSSFLDRLEITRDDNSIILERVIKANGRSIMSIGGRSVNRAEMEELGSLLVNISSQHEHQSLLRSDVQLNVLDRFAHNGKLLESVKAKWLSYAKAKAYLSSLEENESKLRDEIDYISFCLNELEKANLVSGEDETLAEELKRISSFEALTEQVSTAQNALKGEMSEGVLTLLAHAVSALSKASDKDPSLSSYHDRLKEVMIETEDVSSSLRDYLSTLTFSEEELEEKSSRLALLQRIRKKYGPTIDAAIKKRDEYREKVNSANNSDELIENTLAEVKRCESEYNKEAKTLHNERVKVAKKLSQEVLAMLKKLGMKDATFEINISESSPSTNGSDSVTFLIAANKGEKLSPIASAASGGELSRIMLSLKGVLSSSDEVDTLIFDEVDAGIGGAVANAVADELLSPSISHQVICITHLPQIASKAEEHFVVSKAVKAGRTISSVSLIEGEEREKEVARLLSGDVSNIALEHARSLLEVQASK